eukprot:XP_013972066.1 RNA-binding protein Nova-2 [Canis lupus familiaris]
MGVALIGWEGPGRCGSLREEDARASSHRQPCRRCRPHSPPPGSPLAAASASHLRSRSSGPPPRAGSGGLGPPPGEQRRGSRPPQWRGQSLASVLSSIDNIPIHSRDNVNITPQLPHTSVERTDTSGPNLQIRAGPHQAEGGDPPPDCPPPSPCAPAEEGEYFLKVLIPSYAAGSIIGKGGQTIVQLQKETGATIKLSKSKDFYPGTTERVCLVQGTAEALNAVHSFIAEKVREIPQAMTKPEVVNILQPQTTMNPDRAKQAKLIVPNSTAGLIIGKGGATVKAVMEQSGAWVQLSQKPEGINLQERVVTVSGEPEQVHKAVSAIVQKVQEDPQSSSCLNISYANVAGPVANSNPTGSPYASPADVLPAAAAASAAAASGLLGPAGLAGVGAFPAALPAFSGTDLLAISTALNTLASYGYNTNSLGLGLNSAAASGVLAAVAAGANPAAAAAANLLASYAGEAGAGPAGGAAPPPPPPPGALGSFALAAAANGYLGAGAGGGAGGGGGPLVAAAAAAGAAGGFLTAEKLAAESAKELVEIAVPENLVGAILGKGGKTLVEYQELTGARIQISKKGEFLPGTRNRRVTITGSPAATQAAQYLISQRVTYEQGVRASNPQKVG